MGFFTVCYVYNFTVFQVVAKEGGVGSLVSGGVVFACQCTTLVSLCTHHVSCGL